MPLPDPIIEVLAVFRPLFTAPTWRKLMTLLTGTLLAQGRRTVAAALRHTGHEMAGNFSSFHQVLNRARWSPLAASRQLLLLIIETFVPTGAPIDLVIDETLERRWGSTISKRGHYRDSLLSSRERSVSNSGLRWIVMAVVVTVPWTKQRMALPFLCVLTTSPQVSERLGKHHKTVGDWARQMVGLVRRWLPDRSLRLMGDTAYNILELGVYCQNRQVTLITPFRLDAMLHQPPPPRLSGTIGRPRVVGERLASLKSILNDPNTVWQEQSVPWYGQGKRTIQWCTGTALWYRYGSPPLPLRWVLTRDPSGKHPVKVFCSTDQMQTAEEILADFQKRWCLETTFEESRAHLGIETQRQWSDTAIERSTPLLLGCYSLVTLFGHALCAKAELYVAKSAWYHKTTATFSDILAAVRRSLWGNFSFPTSPSNPDVVLLPRSALDRLAAAVCS